MQNRVEVNHETRAQAMTEGKHDLIHDSLPIQGKLMKNLEEQQVFALK